MRIVMDIGLNGLATATAGQPKTVRSTEREEAIA